MGGRRAPWHSTARPATHPSAGRTSGARKASGVTFRPWRAANVRWRRIAARSSLPRIEAASSSVNPAIDQPTRPLLPVGTYVEVDAVACRCCRGGRTSDPDDAPGDRGRSLRGPAAPA